MFMDVIARPIFNYLNLFLARARPDWKNGMIYLKRVSKTKKIQGDQGIKKLYLMEFWIRLLRMKIGVSIMTQMQIWQWENYCMLLVPTMTCIPGWRIIYIYNMEQKEEQKWLVSIWHFVMTKINWSHAKSNLQMIQLGQLPWIILPYLSVWKKGDEIQVNCSCDSKFMLQVMGETGKEMRFF